MVAVLLGMVKVRVGQAVRRVTPGKEEVNPGLCMAVRGLAAVVVDITKTPAAVITTCIERRVTVEIMDLSVLFGRDKITQPALILQQTQVTCNEIVYSN
jgi:hypothetical protein